MVIKVNVPEVLVVQAQARGVTLETYVEEILAQQAIGATAKAPRVRTAEEIREWLDSLAQFSEKIPRLPETISREWIYQDHD